MIDSLPEPLRASDTLAKYINKDTNDLNLEALVNAHNHATSALGWPADQVVRMPKEDDAEGWGKFYERLGRPSEANAYDLSKMDLTDPTTKEFVESFRETAFATGVNQKQMDTFLGWLGQTNQRVNEEIAKAIEDERKVNEAALDKAWGEKASVYKTEIPKVVERLALKAGLYDPEKGETPEAVLKALNVEGDGMADNPTLMRLLAVMADMTAEPETLPGGGRASTPNVLNAAQAQAEKQARFADPEFVKALNDKGHPKHKEAADEQLRLNKIIAGQTS